MDDTATEESGELEESEALATSVFVSEVEGSDARSEELEALPTSVFASEVGGSDARSEELEALPASVFANGCYEVTLPDEQHLRDSMLKWRVCVCKARRIKEIREGRTDIGIRCGTCKEQLVDTQINGMAVILEVNTRAQWWQSSLSAPDYPLIA
jgi:hypothetical protein